MALINCPECGRKNVSDSADACPDCGYGIKEHFNKIKQDKMEKQRELELEQQRKNAEIEKKLHAEQRIKNVAKPNKPVFSRGLIIYLVCAFLFITFLSILAPLMQDRPEDIEFGTIFLVYLLLVIVPLCVYYFSKYSKAMEEYELAQMDFEAYQRQIVKEQDEEFARIKAEAQRVANSPKCPMCGSHDIQKISTTSRVISVATVGLASGKLGKQYECKNCKHRW